MKFKINKKQLSKKRKQDILMMVGAVTLLFILLPITLSLIYTWNEETATNPIYTSMDQDFFEEKEQTVIIDSFDLSTTEPIFTIEQTTPGLIGQFDNVIWGTNETNNTMVITGAGEHLGPMWVTPWNVSDLISNEILSIHIKIIFPNTPVDTKIALWMYRVTNGKSDIFTDGMGTIDKITVTNKTVDAYFNFTVLELMVHQADYGDCRVFISIDGGDYTFSSADIIDFDFSYYKPTSPNIPTNVIIKYGAGIIGVILIIIGFMSTPYWNPSDKSGIVDKLFNKIFGFLNPKKKGGKK